MHIDRLKEIIFEGESSSVEFKRKITDHYKISKEISAFANTIGGWLFIGVDDDGTVVGVRSEKIVEDFIFDVCQFYIDPPIEPEIEFINYKNKEIVAVFINKSSERPHLVASKGEEGTFKIAYIRVGEKSVQASGEMKRVLKSQRADSKPVRLVFGEMEKRLLNYLDKYERATVMDFSKLVNISKRRSERLMVRLVKAGVLQIHASSDTDYFTLVG